MKWEIKEKLLPHLAGFTDVSTSEFSEMCKNFRVFQFNESKSPKESEGVG